MKSSFLTLPIVLALGVLAFASAAPKNDGDHNVRKARALARTCTGSQLSIRSDPNFSDAAMGGQRGASYVVKNISRSPCTIHGAPGIVLLDRRGRVIGHRIKPTRDGETTIKARSEASFEVGYHSCEFIAGASDRNPKKCRWSQTAQIRFWGINRVFAVRDKLDGGIEEVEGWTTK
jgi:Protein of unknown function (DUF4232)